MSQSQTEKTGARTAAGAQQAGKIGVLTLAVLNITAVVSLRGLPAEAEYGLSSIFYYLFAAVVLLIPVSIVAAELATAWPQKGGVFRWVGEAFGGQWAFLAMFMLWLDVTIWFPTVLTFATVALAYIGPDHKWDAAMASNIWVTLVVVLVVYWFATYIATRGVKAFAAVSKWGGIVGTIVPVIILILLGFGYLFITGKSQVPLAWGSVIPDFTNFNNLVLAASIFLFYAGMEMNAIHVKEIENPIRNYPIAILFSSIATVLIFVLGTLAIAFIIPQSQINLVQSLLISYDDFFKFFHLGFLSPIVAAMLAFGVLGQVTVWVAGTSTGLLAVGTAGYLPPILQKTNENGAPVNLLILQAAIVTLLSLMFVVMPSVQSVYQILSQLCGILYCGVYMLMFAAAIYLRYSQPNTVRPYRVPFGAFAIWLFGGVGFVGALIAFLISFIPPSQIPVGSPAAYVWMLIGGFVVAVVIPFVVYAVRQPGWKMKASDFEPFSWERQK